MPRSNRFALLVALAVAGLGGCECQEPLQQILPEIGIGHPDDPTFSVCATERVRDCAYDFHDVAVGRPKQLTFMIENPAKVDLAIEGVTIEGDAAYAIAGDAPTFVAVGASEAVVVRFTPAVAGPATARVVIASDASNVDEVVIELTGDGIAPAEVDPGAPAIVVDPAVCDFGGVGVGVRATCTLSIRNDGDAPLTLTELAFTADTPTPDVFGFDGAFAVPVVVPPGTAVSASFYASPTSIDPAAGTLVVRSDDVARPAVDVPFTVVGASAGAPTAVARVKSVDGVANTAASPAVQPLDDVVLSGDQSVPGVGAASITSWQWSIVEQPAESSVTLATPTSVDTGFTFSSTQGEVAGVDVAGTFRVRLVVTDENGGVSENDAIVTLNAVPTGGVHVQLTWDTSSNDLDLHLGNGFNVDWCSNQDCYYGNCELSGPNWDGAAGFTVGDPVLDIDDTRGFGPENIRIEEPIDASYIVGVHSYSGEGGGPGFSPAVATVKIYLGGALAQTFTGPFDAKDQFWRVARVEIVDGVPSIEEVGTVAAPWNDCN
jgi:hypothetical protein